MEIVVATGNLLRSQSFAVPHAVWTGQGRLTVAMSAVRWGLIAATLAGRAGSPVRLRNLVDPITAPVSADRMFVSASEP